MKPPLFHVGQAVICISLGARIWKGVPPPAVGKIYIINYVEWYQSDKSWYIGFEEMPEDACYLEEHFAPVEEMPAEAYAELLEAFEPVTA